MCGLAVVGGTAIYAIKYSGEKIQVALQQYQKIQ